MVRIPYTKTLCKLKTILPKLFRSWKLARLFLVDQWYIVTKYFLKSYFSLLFLCKKYSKYITKSKLSRVPSFVGFLYKHYFSGSIPYLKSLQNGIKFFFFPSITQENWWKIFVKFFSKSFDKRFIIKKKKNRMKKILYTVLVINLLDSHVENFKFIRH